jgi:hypothetical protein
VPEQGDHSANQDLLITRCSLLPTVYNSVTSPSGWRPIFSKRTISSDSTTSDGDLFNVPAHEAASGFQQNDGNDCSRTGDYDETTTSILTSSKGKQKAIYPADDADDYQDFHAYQELQFGQLNHPLASQDDQFSQSNVQLDMNPDPNFEDFYLGPGLKPDWNWFTEVSQRLV